MIGKIITLAILGFVIYATSKEIRKEGLDDKKLKDLTLSNIFLAVSGIIFIILFFIILFSLF